MSENEIIFSNAVRGKKIPLRAVALWFSNLSIFGTNDSLDSEFNDAVSEILQGFNLESLSSDRAVRNVRELFKSFGTDPTKWRPSSEAMIRRILKDKGLFRINSLVDINNIVSIRYRLPIGLYDRDKVKGNIIIDKGAEGDLFTGLTGREYSADNKPVVMDETGIIGSPIVDSEKTKITDGTINAIALIFSNIEEQFEHAFNAGLEFSRLVSVYHPGAIVSGPHQID